jgi:hypothetical protein
VKLLQEIASFPERARKLLETQYGIESAEAFYAHAVKDRAGLRAALGIPQAELSKLVHLVEGHLAPDYIDRCRQPVTKHPRGAIPD